MYFVVVVVFQKASVMPLPDGGKSDDRCICSDTIPECDGQTDWFVIIILHCACWHAIKAKSLTFRLDPPCTDLGQIEPTNAARDSCQSRSVNMAKWQLKNLLFLGPNGRQLYLWMGHGHQW